MDRVSALRGIGSEKHRDLEKTASACKARWPLGDRKIMLQDATGSSSVTAELDRAE